MEERRVLAIDQGTTSTRAILFDGRGEPDALFRTRLPRHLPRPGRVEQDPERIWGDTLSACRGVLRESDTEVEAIDCIGITNQRETTLVWERATGRPIHPAIVWQDRRTADLCRRLRDEGREEAVRRSTGLLLDPYFSATKLRWILDRVEGAREAARRGELAFGTVDTWLLWRLTGGAVHATDLTNASRTLLFDLRRERWDEEMLDLFDVPRSLLPEVRDSSGLFGETDPELFGRSLPVTGIAGDQQAATFGQAVFEPGMAKVTYGTGAFLLLNTGAEPVPSESRLLTTIAWRIGGRTTYALEGSIFVAGAAVDWLRDELKLAGTYRELETAAAEIEDTGGVYLVPAFTGLGAPHWDPEARGTITGLTLNSGRAEIARAALEAVGYQTRDLMDAMAADREEGPRTLRVDGGLSANDWAMGFLSDILALEVERPVVTETTALGAACLAGLETGFYGGMDQIAGNWRRERRWKPSISAARRDELRAGWREAVRRTRSGPE